MKVVLGVSGGIAAYKSPEILRGFVERGDEVQPVLTRTAAEFAALATFRALSGRPVFQNVFDGPEAVGHVSLAEWADLLVVAPATAEVIAKFAHGFADDFLSTYQLSHRGPRLLAPAMESAMWTHPAVEENVRLLRARGVRFVGPETGALASGHRGIGRMAEPADVVSEAVRLVEGKDDLAGLRVLVTAGPTREPVDPIRFLSNRSSGKMGFALAQAARERGADVTLLAGPTAAPLPRGVEVRRFETARDLSASLREAFAACDVLVMAAAVSDFIPERVGRRLHRSEGPRSLALNPGEDLLAAIAREKGPRVVVAFAAELGGGEDAARQKMSAKGADWIVVNDVSRPDVGFESEENEVLLLSESGRRVEVSRRPKREVAEKIWDAVSSTLEWKKIPEKT